MLEAVTADDKANIDQVTAAVIAEYNKNGYEFISKIKRNIQALVETHLEEIAPVERILQHYNAVPGATGLLDNPYKYNAKKGTFTKSRAKAKA